MSYDIPVPKVQALSHDTDELNFTDDYADIKGSTIWRNTLATSGFGLTEEELLALRLQNEVYSMKNTSDGKASGDTDGDDIPSTRASVIITMDDELDGREINDFEGSKSSNGESDVKASLTYDASKLQKTQPYTDKVEVADLKELIQKNGIETIDPILVSVENGTAYVVDGHHRLQAFMELGYERVPIHYIHSSELGRRGVHGYLRLIEEIIEGARLCQ